LQYSDVVFQTRTYDPNNYSIPEIIATDVKIEISEGNKSIELKYDSKEKLYIASTKNFAIEAGKTYQLKAVDGKKRNYSAETTVPTKVDFEVQKAVQVPTPNQFEIYTKQWDIPIQWTAPANSYYRMGIWNTSKTEFKQPNGPVVSYESSPAGSYWQTTYERNNESIEKVLTSSNTFYQNIPPPGSTNNEVLIRKAIRFLRIDKNYNDYAKAIQQSYNNGNPFVEPSLVASNIKNGYGCFGSYFKLEKEYELPE
jgi:hypothetical protein